MARRLTAERGEGSSTAPTVCDSVAADQRKDVPGPEAKTWWRVPLGPRQRTALISWAAFAVTFGCARVVAHAVKNNVGSVSDVHWGDVHLHHYLWGIKLLALSGGVAIHGADRFRDNPLVAAGYGVGAALIIDESALLLHLKDVYWTKHGRVSVVVGTSLIAAVGASFAFIPAWRGHVRGQVVPLGEQTAV
jgi:hypothetical protein